jgi:hypothetical protein
VFIVGDGKSCFCGVKPFFFNFFAISGSTVAAYLLLSFHSFGHFQNGCFLGERLQAFVDKMWLLGCSRHAESSDRVAEIGAGRKP